MSPTPSPSPKQPESALADVLAGALRVLFCGINPGRVSAAAGAHFANPRNDFWRLLHAAGFTSRLYSPQEQREVLAEGIGITNAAARTTPGSGDLRRPDFADAQSRLERIALELGPAWIGFVGKEAYRGTFNERPLLGLQERMLGDTRLFVLPSTSPANAAVPWDERLRSFGELAALSRPVLRPAVRALVLDNDDRVLLVRDRAAAGDPGVWITPGGAVEADETERAALQRELREELHVEPELGPWVWTRRHVWSAAGRVYDTRERFALVRVDVRGVRLDASGPLLDGGEARRLESRWWTLDELRSANDEVAPRRLAVLLAGLVAGGAPPAPIDVGL